jgi:hypothetical protein
MCVLEEDEQSLVCNSQEFMGSCDTCPVKHLLVGDPDFFAENAALIEFGQLYSFALCTIPLSTQTWSLSGVTLDPMSVSGKALFDILVDPLVLP